MTATNTLNKSGPGGKARVPLLDVTDLTRRFGDVEIVDRISFAIHPGQAVALTGVNGSGKTTILRCVVGADTPDDGAIRLDGQPVRETDPRFRATVATALDDADFFPDLTVVEQLELLARAHGDSSPHELITSVLDELGLDPVRDQFPITLSSGQRRRLTLATCFVRPRRLLVLDEPEQRLDAAGRAWLIDRLIREKGAGCGILVASHDTELLEHVADLRIEVGA